MRWPLLLIASIALTWPLGGCSGDDDGGGSDNGNGAAGSGAGSGSGAGGATPLAPPDITKFDLLSAGPGSDLHDDICAANNLPAGCDICVPLGYYDDLDCDDALINAGWCAAPDPGCTPQAADYYVASNGSDSGDGSEGQPFATVQHAQDVAQPGDLIYLRGGTYMPQTETLFTTEGSAAAPITLMSYPGELPILDGTDLPQGNTEGGSTPTWHFNGAKFWRIHGPLQLINGRGAGLLIEEDTQDIDLTFIESSYNGKTASRAGHGFIIVEDQWADAKNIRFINCDAHHNANHRTKSGENVAENLYQHGDGWRIKSGLNIQLVGCRSWHNLDDNYDLVWAAQPVALYQSWSGFAGRDDAQGSNTGTPNFEAAWGEGIKLGYSDDSGAHSAVRCLSWKNVHLGFRMDGGPYLIENATSFENGRRALGWDLGPAPHLLQNSVDLDTLKESTIPSSTTSTRNSWDVDSSFSAAADDFISLDDGPLLGARSSDGSLPVVDFMRLAPGSDLIDAGNVGSSSYAGSAPDIGCFERF